MRLLWSEVQNLPLPALKAVLCTRAKRYAEVTMSDLVAPHPSASNGLYFFFVGEVVCYVGSASSRAIIERVPAHLDSRETGWFGTLLQRFAKEKGNGARLGDVVGDALDARLVTIFKDVEDGDLREAETALRHAFAPTFNSPRRIRAVEGTLASLA